MEIVPGSPAYYERLAAEFAAAPAAPAPPVVNTGPRIYGPPPAESLESNANRTSRLKMEKLFRNLNSPHITGYRNAFKKKYGVNWSTVRNKKIANFKATQNAKAARRREALIRHRNAEWAAYVQHLRNTRPPPGPGVPAQGDPVRVVFGYGGKTRKRRSTKKKDAVVKKPYGTRRRRHM